MFFTTELVRLALLVPGGRARHPGVPHALSGPSLWAKVAVVMGEDAAFCWPESPIQIIQIIQNLDVVC